MIARSMPSGLPIIVKRRARRLLRAGGLQLYDSEVKLPQAAITWINQREKLERCSKASAISFRCSRSLQN